MSRPMMYFFHFSPLFGGGVDDVSSSGIHLDMAVDANDVFSGAMVIAQLWSLALAASVILRRSYFAAMSRSTVIVETRSLSECLITKAAFVRLVAGVHPTVRLQRRRFAKRFAANFAAKRSNSVVTSQMRLQRRFVPESIAANAALERSFS